jgi:excisionase family DNA binding protein
MDNPFEIINQRLERIENLLENIYSNSQNNKANNSYPDILDLQQLASYLNVSKSYIYKMTATNIIPHSKRGKKLYFDKEIVTKWVLENKIFTQGEIEQMANNYLLKNKYGFKKKHK